MLHSIRIQGFRGIETVELKELKNINVLIGENNSGKTSILEAIQLLKDANVIANLYSAAQKRENITAISRSASVDIVKYCFNLERGMELSVDAYDYWGETICASVWGHESSFIEENYSKWGDEIRNVIYGQYEYLSPVVCQRNDFQIGTGERISRVTQKAVIPMEYLSSTTIQSQYNSIKTMYNVMRSEERGALVELLRIFDSRIVGIDKAVRNGRALTFLELEDCGMMPLTVFGDGVKKVLAIANALVKSRGGIVLIDEFETGIHKNALRKVARWLIQAAWKNETQVFLTTHSSEALDALLEAEDACEKLNMYRLEQYKGRTYVKKFEGDDLSTYRNSRGIDIF